MSLTFESHKLIVTFLPQVHLSFVLAQQLLVGTAYLPNHLTDLWMDTHEESEALIANTLHVGGNSYIFSLA